MKIKEIECFKVVCNQYGEFVSCGSSKNKYLLTYKENETIYPKIGKIFVFDTKEDADWFICCMFLTVKAYRIFKGIGTNPTKMKFMCNNIDFINIFWNQKKNKKKIETLKALAPRGTLLVDSFTPKELIN